jgi:hypothetical protein
VTTSENSDHVVTTEHCDEVTTGTVFALVDLEIKCGNKGNYSD